MLRQLIRWIATSLVSLGMIVAVEPVVHVNVEHLAKQRHWDEFLAKWWPEVPDLSPLLEARWFWLCFGSSLGVALALWIVRLFPERRLEANVTASGTVLPSDPQHASAPVAGEAPFRAEPPTMAEYDRDRRRREIDELIASITAGKDSTEPNGCRCVSAPASERHLYRTFGCGIQGRTHQGSECAGGCWQ
jgi:hypothetical protein